MFPSLDLQLLDSFILYVNRMFNGMINVLLWSDGSFIRRMYHCILSRVPPGCLLIPIDSLSRFFDHAQSQPLGQVLSLVIGIFLSSAVTLRLASLFPWPSLSSSLSLPCP